MPEPAPASKWKVISPIDQAPFDEAERRIHEAAAMLKGLMPSVATLAGQWAPAAALALAIEQCRGTADSIRTAKSVIPKTVSEG